jgi:hypothetical protein
MTKAANAATMLLNAAIKRIIAEATAIMDKELNARNLPSP